jgi:hypothetical protein
MPAALTVILATLVAGWFLLLPSDNEDLGYSALSQLAFSANVYFWRTTNYFAGASEEKPLLHTWSLAVEEQFYLLLPFILLAVFKLSAPRQKVALWVMLILVRKFLVAITSLMFSRVPGFQLAMTLLVLFASYTLQIKYKPYQSPATAAEVIRDHLDKADPNRWKGSMHTGLHEELMTMVGRSKAARAATSQRAIQWSSATDMLETASTSLLFDYNTVETILLGCAILVSLAGVMFETGAFNSSRYYDTQRDVIAARRAYYGMVSWVDQRVGDLLATLAASGLDENTVVIFTADHGEMLGERGMWFKMCMYEWAVRVPLFVRWPGRFAPARVAKNVSLVDLLPTMMDLARPSTGAAPAAVDPLDGRSLVPLLRTGRDDDWSDCVISDFTAGGVGRPLRMVRRGQWKLIRIAGHPPMLFDLASDPDELHDRSADPAASEVLASMMAIAPDGYDADAIDRRVRESQRRRLLVRDVDAAQGTPSPWSWQARPGDDTRYVRGGGLKNGEHATKARARFPYVDEAHEADPKS